MLDKRRSEELVRCILNVLHGNVCSIIQYGRSACPVSEIAVLTHYKINADEELRLSSAVVEFNQRHKESVSVIDIDYGGKDMKNWELYDVLLDGIPSDLFVDECIIGLNWTFVRAGDYAGIAMTFQGSSVSGLTNGSCIGRSLRDVAAGIKSWDMLQSSVGMAACNAWYNARDKMAALGLDQEGKAEQAGAGQSIFNQPLESIVGKKVTVIGHFPYVEKQLGDKCDLSILERDPEDGDLLDSACEYILPEQDFVFITGMTLINKTLPRLLSLTENAHTFLVGPSSPITPKLFPFGVNTVASFYVTDIDRTRVLVSQAAHTEIFRGGRRVIFSRQAEG